MRRSGCGSVRFSFSFLFVFLFLLLAFAPQRLEMLTGSDKGTKRTDPFFLVPAILSPRLFTFPRSLPPLSHSPPRQIRTSLLPLRPRPRSRTGGKEQDDEQNAEVVVASRFVLSSLLLLKLHTLTRRASMRRLLHVDLSGGLVCLCGTVGDCAGDSSLVRLSLLT
jgi:hypothetical protein